MLLHVLLIIVSGQDYRLQNLCGTGSEAISVVNLFLVFYLFTPLFVSNGFNLLFFFTKWINQGIRVCTRSGSERLILHRHLGTLVSCGYFL